MTTSIFDALIVGAGPAGLSAALALSRQTRTAVVFNTETFRNALSKHMHTIPTWDHQDPADFRAAARKELVGGRYKTTQLADVAIRSLKKNTDGTFTAVDDQDKTWLGRKVILAYGIRDIMPEDTFPGYTECWTKGIFHCLFCHGYEERGAPSVGVLSWGMVTPPFALKVSLMARNLADSVVIYTNANDEAKAEVEKGNPGPRITVDNRKIVRFEKASEKSDVILHFEDGSTKREGFIAHMPNGKLGAPFAEELGCELVHPSNIKVNPPFQETTVEGVFAAGDIATMAPAVMNALSSGQFAGIGVVQSLGTEVKE